MVSPEVLLNADGLCRAFHGPGRGRGAAVAAVDDVSFEIARGEAIGLVGSSGCGKTSLVRLLLLLDRPDRGVVRFDGQPLSLWPERRIRPLRKRFQAVFQDPTLSLDPCQSVASIIAEPLDAHRVGSPSHRRQAVHTLLEQVGLPPACGHRLPRTFSGGERQRVAIARALAPGPELLILDEPVSSLDRSVQVQILDLIARLRDSRGLTLLLVSHDLDVVRATCNRVLVMERGRIVEEGPVSRIFAEPEHPVTRQLLAASRTRARPRPG